MNVYSKNFFLGLGCICITAVILFAFQCVSYGTEPIRSYEDLQHLVVGIAWRAHASLKVNDLEYIEQNKWYTFDYYKNSIYNVIAQGISDCVTQRAEFSNAGKSPCCSEHIVEFEVKPTMITYTKANWNALVLWNFLARTIVVDEHATKSEISYKTIEQIGADIKNKYSSILNINEHINKAVSDIKTYAQDLELYDFIECWNERCWKFVFRRFIEKEDIEKELLYEQSYGYCPLNCKEENLCKEMRFRIMSDMKQKLNFQELLIFNKIVDQEYERYRGYCVYECVPYDTFKYKRSETYTLNECKIFINATEKIRDYKEGYTRDTGACSRVEARDIGIDSYIDVNLDDIISSFCDENGKIVYKFPCLHLTCCRGFIVLDSYDDDCDLDADYDFLLPGAVYEDKWSENDRLRIAKKTHKQRIQEWINKGRIVKEHLDEGKSILWMNTKKKDDEIKCEEPTANNCNSFPQKSKKPVIQFGGKNGKIIAVTRNIKRTVFLYNGEKYLGDEFEETTLELYKGKKSKSPDCKSSGVAQKLLDL